MIPVRLLPELNDAELRLFAYLSRHTLGFGRADVRLTDDEVMHGRRKKGGERMDLGSGIASRNRLKRARASLAGRGLLVVNEDTHDPARLRRTYSLSITDTGAVSTVDTDDDTVSTTDTQASTADAEVSITDAGVSTVDTRTQGRDLERDLGRILERAQPALPGLPAQELSPETSRSERDQIIADLWQLQEQLRADVKPNVRGQMLTADAKKAIGKLLDQGFTEADGVHVLHVYAAEARQRVAKAHPLPLEYLDGVSNWRPMNFSRSLVKEIADASRAPAQRIGTTGWRDAPGPEAFTQEGDVDLCATEAE